MLWSILIAAIPERYHLAAPLLYSLLETQAVARIPDVEVLYLMDNRRRSVGSKRNALLDAARGEYVSFIDDDDQVAIDYVNRIRNAIISTRRTETPADVIVFPQRCTLQPHGIVHECTYSLNYWRERVPEQRRVLVATDKENVLRWTGPPAHTMVWRRETIGDIRFTERQFGEDTDFVDRVCERAQREWRIDGEPIYFYNWDERTTATRE